MLAGLLMSVVYGMVDDDCDDIFSSAIDVCCIWYGLLMSLLYIEASLGMNKAMTAHLEALGYAPEMLFPLFDGYASWVQ